MESAEIISPPTFFASFMESAVFPTAVGPVRMINGCFTASSFIQTILLNFFSSSYLLMVMMVGRPCGQ